MPTSQQFSIAELKEKRPPSTMHELARPASIQKKSYQINDIQIEDSILQNASNKEKSTQKVKSKSKKQNKENKMHGKIVRVKISSANNIQAKQGSLKSIPSIKAIQSLSNQSPIEQIQLQNSQMEIQQAVTTNNIGEKRSNILKNNTNKDIKSLHSISYGGVRQDKNAIIKSTKSIKFNDKNDVFTYKSENKLSNSKRKIKSFRMSNVPYDDSEQCCQLI